VCVELKKKRRLITAKSEGSAKRKIEVKSRVSIDVHFNVEKRQGKAALGHVAHWGTRPPTGEKKSLPGSHARSRRADGKTQIGTA
jgi:hypothetical protein